eukprot:CAMPEP_0117677200 /NCGR_PEP_ID=MMETSP0804-20121206/16616_1 /TAXON_ID=1074897 /ORGANISM="Tetraselmis astigmatica, Strain CCMP880" /LENGTH=259 /DNA_ID=CAMNT_0005486463 /DNA_START=266 /DNA_END=1046 /DNA_ORIENTATION=+
MKLLVAVKRCVDYNARIRVKADKEALRMKEKKLANEIVAVSLGPKASQDTLRTALAMGADRATHVETDVELQPLAVAKMLAEIVKREEPGMVILGKQAIDDDGNQTVRLRLAHFPVPCHEPVSLNRRVSVSLCAGADACGHTSVAEATFASKVELDAAKERASVTREVDGGLDTLSVKLPAVITTDLRLNEPRFATLPNIMKAKKKPMEQLKAEELGVDISPRLEMLEVNEPPKRQGGLIVSSVDELIDKLKNEAKVIS